MLAECGWDDAEVDIASRLEACKRRWDLAGGSGLGGGFRCAVFACPADGGQVVVKLTPTPEEARLKTAALASWAHTGAAVRLIDADISHDALLLERIRPGTPLPGGDDPVSVEVAADLLARLHQAAHEALTFPALETSTSAWRARRAMTRTSSSEPAATRSGERRALRVWRRRGQPP
jgi:streptomycin 6-kinase